MNVIAVIPARYGAQRFPGKMLAPLAGKPLVQHVYERACEVQGIDKVLIATDDARIAEACAAFGADVAMTSPDCPSGTDRIYEATKNAACDVVLNIQGDEPCVDPASIEALVSMMVSSPDIDMGTLVFTCNDEEAMRDPNVVKVVIDAEHFALYFSRSLIPYPREKQDGRAWYKHLGIYAYRAEVLKHFVTWKPSLLERTEKLEQLRALENGVDIKVVFAQRDSIGVDTPEDLERVEKFF